MNRSDFEKKYLNLKNENIYFNFCWQIILVIVIKKLKVLLELYR